MSFLGSGNGEDGVGEQHNLHYFDENARQHWEQLSTSLTESQTLTTGEPFVDNQKLANVLDPHNASLERERNSLAVELEQLEQEIDRRKKVSSDVERKAINQLYAAAYALGTFFIGQVSLDVFSATKFVKLASSIGFHNTVDIHIPNSLCGK